MFVQVQNHQPQGHVSFQSTPIEHPILRARTGNGRRPLPQRASPRGTSQRQCRVKRHLGITLHGTGISYSMCMHDACTIYSICVMCVLCIYKILYIYTKLYIPLFSQEDVAALGLDPLPPRIQWRIEWQHLFTRSHMELGGFSHPATGRSGHPDFLQVRHPYL